MGKDNFHCKYAKETLYVSKVGYGGKKKCYYTYKTDCTFKGGIERENCTQQSKARYRGYPSGQRLYSVYFDLGVPPCCLCAMPILPDLQLPKQN